MSVLNSADVSNTSSESEDSDPATRLARVKSQALEAEMPVLDACIRETVRMYATGALLRMNVGKRDVVLQTRDDGGGTLFNFYCAKMRDWLEY